MRRVISVWFPTLATDRIARHEAGHAPKAQNTGLNPQKQTKPAPVIVVAPDRSLTALNATAAAFGLRVGMKQTQAETMVADLQIHRADPASDHAALQQLAAWCLRYAPLTSADSPDGLWIDISGCAHLHGGEAKLLRDLLRRLRSQGLAAHAAVADTPSVAHATARFGNGGVVPPGVAMPGDFPLKALRIPADILAKLQLMGFEQIGALAKAPRAPLVKRYGKILTLRLDQAAGRVFEPILPVLPPQLIQARLTFIEPLMTAEAFSTVIMRLVQMVCGDLERAGQGARQLDLLFERTDGSLQAVRIGTAKPGRDANHLGRMLTEKLEQVDPGLGVEAMRLIVAAADPLSFVQSATSLIETPAFDIAPLVDRLTNRLGQGRVYRIAPVESYVPERSVRRVQPLTKIDDNWPMDQPWPVRLLHPPQRIDAMAQLPDYAPVAFVWRQVRHLVRHADGPDRISGEWWKRDSEWMSVRDYFRIEDEDGRRFWLFRRGDGRNIETGDLAWFLHGFF